MGKTQWPPEGVFCKANALFDWRGSGANQVLDFHGNPVTADICIFSDGNHHMALEACLQEYARQHSIELFYATLPPPVLLEIIKANGICLANLCLPVSPDLLIGPATFLSQAGSVIALDQSTQFARSRGNSFLVRPEYAAKVTSFKSIVNNRLKLFISNPVTETASHQLYLQTLENMALEEGFSKQEFRQWMAADSGYIVTGSHVHHREVVERLRSGAADVALLYHHLALRYASIFSEYFVAVPVYASGTPAPAPQQVLADYHIAKVKNNNLLTDDLLDFFVGDKAAAIYARFGIESAITSL